jgi:hypothetical protein
VGRLVPVRVDPPVPVPPANRAEVSLLVTLDTPSTSGAAESETSKATDARERSMKFSNGTDRGGIRIEHGPNGPSPPRLLAGGW